MECFQFAVFLKNLAHPILFLNTFVNRSCTLDFFSRPNLSRISVRYDLCTPTQKKKKKSPLLHVTTSVQVLKKYIIIFRFYYFYWLPLLVGLLCFCAIIILYQWIMLRKVMNIKNLENFKVHRIH